jgi:CRISPR-associated protein (Cas_Cmr5)
LLQAVMFWKVGDDGFPISRRHGYALPQTDRPALAAVQRLGDPGNLLLDHLASAGVSRLEGATMEDFAERVRRLDADSNMIATREMLQVAKWLKRAM